MIENTDRRLPIPHIDKVPISMFELAESINNGSYNFIHVMDDPKWQKHLNPFWVENAEQGIKFWEHILNTYGRNGKLEVPILQYKVLPDGELGVYDYLKNSVSVDIGSHDDERDDFLKTHLHEFRHYYQPKWMHKIRHKWYWFFDVIIYPFKKVVEAVEWIRFRYPGEWDALRFEAKEYPKVVGYEKWKKPKYTPFRKPDEND